MNIDDVRKRIESEPSIEGPGGCRVCMHLFTPEEASIILAHANLSNRILVKHHLKRIVKDREDGNWEPNADAISFSVAFELFNGQHRLKMLAMTKTSEKFLCVWNAPSAMKFVTDRGRPWSASAKMGKLPELTAVATMLQVLTHGAGLVTDTEMRKMYAKRSADIERLVGLSRKRKIYRKAHVVTAFCVAAGDLRYREKVITLFENLVDHAHPNNTASALNKFIEGARASMSNYERWDAACMILRGIQAYVLDEEIRVFRFTKNGLLFFMPTSKYRHEEDD